MTLVRESSLSTLKEIRNDIHMSEDIYEEFKVWYLKNYKRPIHEDLMSFYHFYKTSEEEIFNQIQEELGSWYEYQQKFYKEMDEIEEYLSISLNEFFSDVSGDYLFEVRNLEIGDSNRFYRENDTSYRVETQPHKIDIYPYICHDGFLDVKKKSILKATKKKIKELVDENIKNIVYKGTLQEAKELVKIVYGGILIKKNSNESSLGYELVISIGIEEGK